MPPTTARPIIAIDGPAASGKGTLARRLADALGFAHLDTGGLYRGVALALLREGGDPADPQAAAAMARHLGPHLLPGLLNDPALRTESVSQGASRVSAVPAVREALLSFQRAYARCPPDVNGRPARGAVLDGRDIGTVICPEADAKLFVTASVTIRADRRLQELLASGFPAIPGRVLEEMQDRDARDRARAVAPLMPADDAFILDTSDMDADEAFERALAYIRSKPAFAGL